MTNPTLTELTTALPGLPASPSDLGPVEMIVVRPAPGGRSTPDSIALSRLVGVADDHWSVGAYSKRPDMQVSLINVHVLDLIAGERDRWALAGDNLVVDLDLSSHNLPAGTRLGVGSAVIEISPTAHRGCSKFSSRFGEAAREFVNLGEGPDLRLRGAYASVVVDGLVHVNDQLRKL